MMVSVFAPVSVGNVSVGFDSLGLALRPLSGELLGDVVHLRQSETGQNEFVLTGSHTDYLPAEKEKNIAWHVLLQFNQALLNKGLSVQSLHMNLEKNIPVSSGLGSSGCSVVAAFAALNEWYELPFTPEELLKLMGQSEAEISGSLHYDNVAPTYLGGMQLMVQSGDDVTQTLPHLAGVYWVIAFPDVEVSTQAARDLLPQKYDRETAIDFAQNLAGFVDACHRNDKLRAFDLMKDVIAEPYRAAIIPKFIEAKSTLSNMGSLAVGISGSGPTLFSACDDLKTAQIQADWLKAHYLSSERGFVHICQADEQGARRIETVNE